MSEAFDVEIVEMPHTLADPEFIARQPEARADDLMQAFADSSIAGIISTIGGDDSIRILPFIDLDTIGANPKVFLGYSDTTVTHMACLRAGLVSFYGPSIMAGFAENGGISSYLADGVQRVLFSSEPVEWPENRHGWTAEHLDWAHPDNQAQPRRLRSSVGWRWLQGQHLVQGPLVVGCVEVLDGLRGTPWWPDLGGAVLAIETSEQQPPPSYVAGFLRSLAAIGDLRRIVGLLFGRPGGSELPASKHSGYDDAILKVVRDEQRLVGLPIVTGMDFGHTDPMWTLPEGMAVRLDPADHRITLGVSTIA